MNFRHFLHEQGYKPTNIDKYLTSSKRRKEFLESLTRISTRHSGMSLKVLRDSTKPDGFLISLDNVIFYPGEFDYAPISRLKSCPKTNSRIKLVQEHLKTVQEHIPVGAELNIILTKNNKIILINSALDVEWSIEFGKLEGRTFLNGVSTEELASVLENQEKLSPKVLKMSENSPIFYGYLGTPESFDAGIKDENLRKVFSSAKLSMQWDNPEILVQNIMDFLSEFEESLLISNEYGKFNLTRDNSSPEQSDKCDCPLEELQYEDKIRSLALGIVQGINISNKKLHLLLQELSIELKTLKVPEHPKKDVLQVKDDIQGLAKLLLTKKLPGNNNALIVSEFDVLSKAEVRTIRKALKEYDNVNLGVVTPLNLLDFDKWSDITETKQKMIKEVFPDIKIHHFSNNRINDNLNRVLELTNINTVLVDSERVQSFRNSLGSRIDVNVKEYPKGEPIDMSDYQMFKKLAAPQIHSMYDELNQG